MNCVGSLYKSPVISLGILLYIYYKNNHKALCRKNREPTTIVALVVEGSIPHRSLWRLTSGAPALMNGPHKQPPEGPSTLYLRSLVPKAIPVMVFWIRDLKCWVLNSLGLGPSQDREPRQPEHPAAGNPRSRARSMNSCTVPRGSGPSTQYRRTLVPTATYP